MIEEDKSDLSGKIIYESYKPRTLEEVKEYTNYVMSCRTAVPNEVDEITSYYPKTLSGLKEFSTVTHDGLSTNLSSYLLRLSKRSHSNLCY